MDSASGTCHLLLDRDRVGNDHGVLVIVEFEHPRRDPYTDGVAFTAITVHYHAHDSLPFLQDVRGCQWVLIAKGLSLLSYGQSADHAANTRT